MGGPRLWGGLSRSRVAAFTLALAAVCATAAVGAQERARAPVREGRESPGVEEAYAELPNFHRVNEHFYRGGQPREGGLAKLASMGVRTILNLRDDDGRAEEEGREAAALGLRYFNVPISRAGRPSRERIEELMALVDAPENRPIFVHCKRGADRTGAFVAAYRIMHEGWTAERALAEAEHYGMGFWQHGKKDFINDFYRDHAAPAKQAEPHSSH